MKNFGHIGDPETQTVAGQRLTTAKPEGVPHFDQVHVDYLKKVFKIGQPIPTNALLAGPHQVVTWASIDTGQREVISHIQRLVEENK